MIDEFTNVAGAVATIFVKQGDDFYRIATSLKKADGSRAIGTFLTKNSPAFAKIMNKEIYLGKTNLFGKHYITIYEPVVKDGEVIAILFVGFNFDKVYDVLGQQLAEVKLGQSGYIYAIDVKDEVFVIHPTLKDKKIGEQDSNFQSALKNIIQQKDGFLDYIFDGRDKVAAFTSFDKWNLVFVVSADLEEMLVLNNKLRSWRSNS